MKLDRQTVFILIAAFAVGYYCSNSSPSPRPGPEDRPVLRWVVRTAKSLLWLAAFADPPPPIQADQRMVQAPAVGHDGYPLLDNARGL